MSRDPTDFFRFNLEKSVGREIRVQDINSGRFGFIIFPGLSTTDENDIKVDLRYQQIGLITHFPIGLLSQH